MLNRLDQLSQRTFINEGHDQQLLMTHETLIWNKYQPFQWFMQEGPFNRLDQLSHRDVLFYIFYIFVLYIFLFFCTFLLSLHFIHSLHAQSVFYTRSVHSLQSAFYTDPLVYRNWHFRTSKFQSFLWDLTHNFSPLLKMWNFPIH